MLFMLDFMLMRDVSKYDESTDHYVGGLSWVSYEVIFYKVLQCPHAEPYVQGENINDYRERYEERFHQFMLGLGLPLLGRMTDYYDDAWYDSEEIAQLRDECLIVQDKTNDEDALEGLRAMVNACDEALKHKLSLSLVAD